MRWLGLDWDEGPEVGGPFGPTASPSAPTSTPTRSRRLRESGATYDCYCTTEEVEARRKASGSKIMGYDGFCRELTDDAGRGLRGRGTPARRPVPDARPADHLRRPGPRRGHLPDRARARLRARARQRRPALHAGQPGRRRDDGDHPRAARRGPALQHPAPDRALRGARGDRDRASRPPRFGHLPYRDGRGQQEALQARPRGPSARLPRAGFLPEGLLNYLALLGWAIAEDRDVFTLEEMVAAFDIAPGQPQPGALRPQEGRGDQRRAHADAEPRGDDRARLAVPARRPASSTTRPRDQQDAADHRGDAV